MQINLEDLVNRLRAGEDLNDNDIAVEATLAKTKCSRYHSPREHLKLFANTYIIENAIKDLYDLAFNDPFMHHYIYEGRGVDKCDCVTRDFAVRLEIKWFKDLNKFFRWVNGQGFKVKHDAQYALCYCSDINKVYVVDLILMTYRDAQKQFEKRLDLIK